jgi:hypothetical protein
MQELPHLHFRFGVLTLDPAHVKATGGLIVHICHGVKLSLQYLNASFRPQISIPERYPPHEPQDASYLSQFMILLFSILAQIK